MSAPAKDGTGVPEKKSGMSKLVSRMKTVLRRSDKSKRASSSSKPVAGPSAIKTPEPAVITPAPAPIPIPIPIPAPVPADSPRPTEGPQPTKVLRSTIDADRARKLAERFKVVLDPLPAGPEVEALRVEKPIRMRIHRSCHLCGTTYGSTRVCAKCEHVRCKSCPRVPPKKVQGKGKAKENEAAVPAGGLEPDTYFGIRDQLLMTKPNPKAGGQPLVRKKPMQRVRRNCHECSALFAPNSKVCTSCQHVRCTDCPRDPAKKKKYPDGYPGDEPSSNPLTPQKFVCHRCNRTFPPIPHPSSPDYASFASSPPPECTRCEHALCKECPRAKPAKVEPSPDPVVLASVRAKLAQLDIESPPPPVVSVEV